MDVIDDFHRRNILPRSAVLPAHSTTAISSNGMCGDVDHTVHPSPLIRISLYCTTGYDSSIQLKPFLRTPARTFRDHVPRLDCEQTSHC